MRKGYKHHASYENLIRSAALGCEICRLFALQLTKNKNGLLTPICRNYASVSPDGIVLPLLEEEEWLPKDEKQLYVTGKFKSFDASYERWLRGVPEVEMFSSAGYIFKTGVFCYPGQLAHLRF
jgi:hypothetical protein